MPSPIVEVKGARELRSALKRIDSDLPNAIKAKFREIAEGAVGPIANALPRKSGDLAGSVRAGATRRAALVRIGKAALPYAGSVEFGGWPRGRPFIKEGRYIFPTAERLAPIAASEASKSIDEVARRAGLS